MRPAHPEARQEQTMDTTRIKGLLSYIPGILCASVIAVAAQYIADILPIHLISASVIAMFIGMGVNALLKQKSALVPGVTFTSKRLLKLAIILLGASLNLRTIMQVGYMSLIIMVFTLAACFGIGHFVGKALKLNWKMSNLISAGTGICGGSAIAAIAPVIEAADLDIAFAMSATFLFDMVMVVLFPFMGQSLGLSDAAYGLWSGTAVNDTSSVVAAGYAFSEAAGDFAVMVKLTRTLSIIPVVIIFSLIHVRVKQKEEGISSKAHFGASLKKAFPAFILGFLALAAVNSIGLIPAVVSSSMKSVSKFLMVMALAAIGLNTSFKDMKKGGGRAMLHGFIISALVVIVALGAIYLEQAMGLL